MLCPCPAEEQFWGAVSLVLLRSGFGGAVSLGLVRSGLGGLCPCPPEERFWGAVAGGAPQKERGSGTSLSKAERPRGELSLLSVNPAPPQVRDNQS